MNSKQVLVIIGIVVVIGICACSVIAFLVLGSSNIIVDRFTSFATEITPSQSPSSTRVTLPTEEPTSVSLDPTPSGEDAPTTTPSISLDPDVIAQMEEIEAQAELLRGLRSTGPVDRALLSPADLYQHVLDDFLSDYSEEEASDDALELSLLGLLDRDFDLFNFYLDLYSEQIAGFYDDEVKKMFVVQEGDFRGMERITYAHEYVHALQDQIWNFDEGLNFNDEACEEDTERCAGIIALVEGDATLLEEQWLLEYGTQTDISQILEFYESYESPVFDSAPLFMQQDFLFPYTYGTDFVREIHAQGGWDAVDDVYANPPLTTEQILHPEKYPWDRPIAVNAPDLESVLGESWREVEVNVLGEWYTQLVLSEQVGDDLSIVAAHGWGGDVYVVMSNDEDGSGAIYLMTIWDSVRDAQEFAAAFLDYGDARFGGREVGSGTFTWDSAEGYVRFERIGNQTLWILAPDVELVDSIRLAVDFPYAN